MRLRHRVLRKVVRHAFSPSAALTAPFARALQRRLRGAGLASADRVFGLKWSGRMTRERLAGLIRHLPRGLTEIYLHPATGPYPGAARGYRYREELEALTAAEVIAACRDPTVRLGGFSDFPDRGTPATLLDACSPRRDASRGLTT